MKWDHWCSMCEKLDWYPRLQRSWCSWLWLLERGWEGGREGGRREGGRVEFR